MKTSTRHHLFTGNPNPQQTRKTSLPTNRVERDLGHHTTPMLSLISMLTTAHQIAVSISSLHTRKNPLETLSIPHSKKKKQNKTKHDRHHAPSPRTDLTVFVSGAIATSRGSSSEILRKRSWYFRDQRTFFTDHRVCKQ